MKDYSSKTSDEWFDKKRWTGFLATCPIGRPVIKECESVREALSIRTIASILSNNEDCDRKFSVKTESKNERVICVIASRK